MNKAESKYFHTATKMDEALLELLEKKDFDYITVKEICVKAGVNRSTFYLHYETTADLLSECVEYINNKCFQRYGGPCTDMKKRIAAAELSELIFISPEYLKPYFEFVKENKRLFKVVLSHPAILQSENTFRSMFKNVFSPVLDRFQFSEEEKSYVIAFYIAGLIAIVTEWIKKDCADTIEHVMRVAMQCVLPGGRRRIPFHMDPLLGDEAPEL